MSVFNRMVEEEIDYKAWVEGERRNVGWVYSFKFCIIRLEIE